MTVCKESVIEDDDHPASSDGETLPKRQHQTNSNNNARSNLIIGGGAFAGVGTPANNKRHNLALPLEPYKQYNKDINFFHGSFPNGGGSGAGAYSNIEGCGLNNNTNCARSCSDAFVKRHSFSLRLDMSPATDGGDAGSRKALFTPEENMEVRKRRYDSSACDKEPRLVLKSGALNAQEVNVEEKGQRYFLDIFTTLVDMRWRWTMFYFCIVYVLSWLAFAVIWWTILKSHGDMDHFDEEGWQPCVVGVQSFSSVFLFSLETQHTIGYGYHRMTDECPEAIVLLASQSIAGVIIEAISVGVFIVKISKPKKRSQTLIFSKNALICQKDGRMYFKFRLADIRHESKLLETHVRVQVVYKKTAPDGEVESIVQKELQVGALEEDEDRILLYWPTTIVHEINKDSPFYEMSCDDLAKAQTRTTNEIAMEGYMDAWEVIAVLEGVVESTGMTTQARTSYLPGEILWGRKFRSMMRSKGSSYVVDFDLFNSTISCDETPLCSARDYRRSVRRKQNPGKSKKSGSRSNSSSSSSSSSTSSDEDDHNSGVDGKNDDSSKDQGANKSGHASRPNLASQVGANDTLSVS